jgi:PAS domain S-box-containing protein
MIAAPVLPTLGFAALILTRWGEAVPALFALGGVALAGAGFRVLGGAATLAAAGWLLRATSALSRAAAALGRGGTPPETRSGIAEIDAAIAAMAAAAGALGARSRAYEAAEEGRRESEARLRDFAETASDWYWETDRDHRFCYLSDRIRGFGQDPASRLGRRRWELAADADRDPEKWRTHQAMLDRHEPIRDFRYARKVGDQPEHTVSVSGRPIFDASGVFAGYRGTARDVSEEALAERLLREAKAAAETANLAKSSFLANMSHELRTPLNAVLGFSEMLERGTAGALDPRQREYVGYIRQSGAHLLDIINEILDLAKIDAGKLELREDEGIDVRSLAEGCAAIVGECARAGGLRLETRIEEGLARLVADETRLKQILLNLLGNAVKFTEPGGSVVLAARSTAGHGVEIEVADTGPGMTPAEIGVALEPFGQIDAGLARRRDGTGLGLPLARRLTELHGGSFCVDSKKGRGTRIVVGLPASRVIEEGATERAALPEAQAAAISSAAAGG